MTISLKELSERIVSSMYIRTIVTYCSIIAISKSYFISVIFNFSLITQEMKYNAVSDNLYYKLSGLLIFINTRINTLISCVNHMAYKEVRI